MKPSFDIFIKSYPADFKWLKYCIKSIDKYVTGINKVIIIVPTDTLYKTAVAGIIGELDTLLNIRNQLIIQEVKEQGVGYIFQQYCKLIAHHYSDADYIMFLDSDCLFTQPVDLRTLIIIGKPVILHTPWDQVGDAICWKEPTEKVFDREVEFEGMRRNGLIYHRRTLEKFQEWFEKRFGCSLLDYFLKVDKISEFNLLSTYAWLYEPEKYCWINTATEEFPPEVLKQFWSHSGLNEKDLEEINKILA